VEYKAFYAVLSVRGCISGRTDEQLYESLHQPMLSILRDVEISIQLPIERATGQCSLCMPWTRSAVSRSAALSFK